MCAFASPSPSTSTPPAAAELPTAQVAARAPTDAARIGRQRGALRHPVTGRASSDLLLRPRAGR
jgi:hypothetical protein